MIHLGIHTDNWRPLSVGFEGACEKIAATGLKHIEFCAIHGQNFIAALGYDPGVSLQSNPRAIRHFLDRLGLKVSQIDGSYPMMGPNGSAYGVQYVTQSIRFAAELAQLLASGVIFGLSLGSIYFLMSIGLSLCFGLMRIISLDQLLYYSVGAYLTYTVSVATGSVWLGILAGVAMAVRCVSGTVASLPRVRITSASRCSRSRFASASRPGTRRTACQNCASRLNSARSVRPARLSLQAKRCSRWRRWRHWPDW